MHQVLGNDDKDLESNFWLAGISGLICEARPERQHAGCNTSSPATSDCEPRPRRASPEGVVPPTKATTLDAGECVQFPPPACY